MQKGQFCAHVPAQLGIEVGQGFIEQEDLWLPHDGPPDRHALSLTARKFFGLAFEQVFNVEDLGGRGDFAVDFGLGATCQSQGKRQVLCHVHVRVQRIVLKNHGDVAGHGMQLRDVLAADDDLALGDLFQSGDHAQGGAFAAARFTQQHDEFAWTDRQVEFTDDSDIAKTFDEISKFKVCHGAVYSTDDEFPNQWVGRGCQGGVDLAPRWLGRCRCSGPFFANAKPAPANQPTR